MICYLMTYTGRSVYRAGGLTFPTASLRRRGPDHLFFFPRDREEGRRMVSEDSQHLGRLPKVHRLGDLRDLDETRHREMPTKIRSVNDPANLTKLSRSFVRSGFFLEERNDDIPQVPERGTRDTGTGLATMIVLTTS